MMDADMEKVYYSEEELKACAAKLGKRITEDYAGEEVFVIGILKGAVVFFSDLIREIKIPTQIDFMIASSYGNSKETSGTVKILKDLDYDIAGKNVIIVEDIIDSGLTMKYLMQILAGRNPKTMRLCALLNKPSRRRVDVKIDYCGFEVPDEFLVGYGLDYAEKYRNLPYIGVLKKEIYAED